MPLTPVGLAGALIPMLAASGMLGPAMPQLASGVAAGVILYNTSSLKVITVDAGTLGVGAGAAPVLVPQPLLLSSLLTAFAATGILGPMSPLLALGLANGLSIGFLQGLLVTVHPTVGVGAGVAKFVAGTAVPSMIAGFASVGMVGPGAIKKATAIGIALDITFLALVLPTPIVGPPTPLPSAGAGFGQIV